MKTTKTTAEIMKVMAELASYTEMMDELSIQVESLKDEIKAFMIENDLYELNGEDGSRATYSTVRQNKFNSSLFKKDFADIYMEYCKKVEYKRFGFSR